MNTKAFDPSRPGSVGNPVRADGRFRRAARAAAAGVLFLLSACEPFPDPPANSFKAPEHPIPYTASKALQMFDASPDEGYRIGEGDTVALQVWDRPDLSVSQIVGPDGVLTVPVAGPLKVSGLSREEAAKSVRSMLARLFDGITVTVRVEQYAANRVVILGKVRNPGVLRFDGTPTLLEAIAKAGGLSDETRTFTHCAVVRGRDRVAWLDLKTLLEAGDLSLNLRLKPGDLVLIPEWIEPPVYVLGQIQKPGPYKWTRGMTVMDALALAGGLTRDAAGYRLTLVRPSSGQQIQFSHSDLVDGVPGVSVALEPGDILYAPSSVLADLGYVLEKINPFGWVFLVRGFR